MTLLVAWEAGITNEAFLAGIDRPRYIANCKNEYCHIVTHVEGKICAVVAILQDVINVYSYIPVGCVVISYEEPEHGKATK